MQSAANLERAPSNLPRNGGDKYCANCSLLIAATKKPDAMNLRTREVIDPIRRLRHWLRRQLCLAAARALVQNTQLSAREIAEKGLRIAAPLVFTTTTHVGI